MILNHITISLFIKPSICDEIRNRKISAGNAESRSSLSQQHPLLEFGDYGQEEG